jgi:endonuclease/exonuclease/phosphatase family metal-dependent hydrolase
MSAIPADIWVLTETHDDLTIGPQHTAVHSAQRPISDYPRRVKPGSRWVSIWSSYPIELVSLADADDERTVSAMVQAPNGPIVVFGTVMPWRGDKGRNATVAVKQQVGNWCELQRRFPASALCVAGDFNADLLPARSMIYPNAEARRALSAGLEECGLLTITAPEATPGPQGRWLIDHIALPKDWELHARVSAVWKEENGKPRLSDHWGTVVQVDLDKPPRKRKLSR